MRNPLLKRFDLLAKKKGHWRHWPLDSVFGVLSTNNVNSKN